MHVIRFLSGFLFALTTASAFAADAPGLAYEAGGPTFLRAYCLDCHSGDSPEGGLSLEGFQQTEILVKERSTTDRVLEMVRLGLMPPQDADQPSLEEIQQFAGLAEAALDHADRHAPRNPGRVTMRRLNRGEYSRTMRDLLGIDFDPAADFPADDVGHGFDNIGDVLSLPPVLMERYLAAAEVVSDRAMGMESPASIQRARPASETEPFGGSATAFGFRGISSNHQDDPVQGGPISVAYDVPQGKYVFRTRLYASAPQEQQVHVAILACSPLLGEDAADDETISGLAGPDLERLRPFKVVETIEVKSRQELLPLDAVVKIPEIPGLNRIAVVLSRPQAGDEEITAFVGSFSLEGPVSDKPCLFRQQVDRSPEAPQEERTRQLMDWLARRAYRRAPTKDEVVRLVNLAESVTESGGSWEDGIQLALQAVLVSPKFLFRMEQDADPLSTETSPLDEFQLASRMAYFLWSTMPDDELIQHATEGTLRTNLAPQVRRMLADPRAETLVSQFGLQWLQLQRLSASAPDQSLFPTFSERLRDDMLQESVRFLTTVIQEDRSVLDLLGADFTYLNERLARHYGIADTNGNRIDQPWAAPAGEPLLGPEFRRVTFAEPNQGGLLRQASILTATSNPTRTSPVKRGLWVLEQLLGRGPPPPPPGIPELEDDHGPLTGTLRERMEQHRANPSCASCHAQMDPIGFAFENYDAIGRFRAEAEGQPIDASGVLPGGVEFNGPSELIEILKDRRRDFVRCLTEAMMTYALGRGLEFYDRPAINEITEQMEADGDRFSTLVLEIVRSDPFQQRRGQPAVDP